MEQYRIICIDEFQFFNENTLLKALAVQEKTDKKIFLIGLEKDILGKEWPIVTNLKNKYDLHIVRLTAHCDHTGCNLPATENLFMGDPKKINEDKKKFKVFCKPHHKKYVAQILKPGEKISTEKSDKITVENDKS